MNTKEGRKVKKVTTVAASAAPRNSASGPSTALSIPADKPHEGHHHDERAGRGFAEGQAVDHLRGVSHW
jgi:ribosomal protein L13E